MFNLLVAVSGRLVLFSVEACVVYMFNLELFNCCSVGDAEHQ